MKWWRKEVSNSWGSQKRASLIAKKWTILKRKTYNNV